MHCGKCGAELQAPDKFCFACGASTLPSSGPHRKAIIRGHSLVVSGILLLIIGGIMTQIPAFDTSDVALLPILVGGILLVVTAAVPGLYLLSRKHGPTRKHGLIIFLFPLIIVLIVFGWVIDF